MSSVLSGIAVTCTRERRRKKPGTMPREGQNKYEQF